MCKQLVVVWRELVPGCAIGKMLNLFEMGPDQEVIGGASSYMTAQ